jgi:hypothetical protein
MAVVQYTDCSGNAKSVDKNSTFEICSTDISSFIYNSNLWRVEEVGSCAEVIPPTDDSDVDTPVSSGNFRVSITHNIPNRLFNIVFSSGGSYKIGFNTPYEDSGQSNVFVPEFEYSLGDVITMETETGNDEQYILTDVRESSPTGDVRLSNIGQRTSDFESVGRSVASTISYVFFFTKVDGELTDEETIDSDLVSGDNGNTSDVRSGGVTPGPG